MHTHLQKITKRQGFHNLHEGLEKINTGNKKISNSQYILQYYEIPDKKFKIKFDLNYRIFLNVRCIYKLPRASINI